MPAVEEENSHEQAALEQKVAEEQDDGEVLDEDAVVGQLRGGAVS